MAEIFPNGAIAITDDAEAKAYLAYHNRLTPLTEPLPGKPHFPRRWVFWATAEAYSLGHWCAGYEQEIDNGYMVVILPTDRFTKEQAADFCNQFVMQSCDRTGPTFSQLVPVDEIRN